MEELKRDLHSNDEVVRIYAAQDLAETGAPAAAEALAARLEAEPSQAVRDAMVSALGQLPLDGVAEALFDLFRSPDPYLRNAAIRIFAGQGAPAVGFLTPRLDPAATPDAEARKLILDALFLSGAAAALPGIRAGLEDPSVNARITAVEYLGAMGDHDSLDVLFGMIAAAGDEPMLRLAVFETIRQVARRKEDLRRGLELLAPDLDFKDGLDPLYGPQALGLAGRLADGGILARLVAALPDPHSLAGEIGAALAAAVDEAPELMDSPDIRDLMDRYPGSDR